MNKNFPLKSFLELLKLHEARANNKGVALFAVICLILVGAVVGSTLLINSFKSKEDSVAQEQKSKSLLLAEAGANRVITLLNQSSGLADQPNTEWQTLTNSGNLSGNYLCSGKPAIDRARNDLISSLNFTSLGTGQYKIRKYEVNNKQATLLIDGKEGNDSFTSIQLTLPLVPYPSSLIGDGYYYYYGVYYQGQAQTPGIWAKQEGTVSLPANSVNSDIFYECLEPNNSPSSAIFSPFWITIAIPTNTGFETGSTDYKMPESPTAKGKNLGSWNFSNCVVELPRGTGNSSTCSGNFTTNDSPDSKGRYHYQLSSINITGGNFKLKIPADKKVVLHVNGNITVSGNTPTAVIIGNNNVSCGNKYVDTALNDTSILDGDSIAATRLQIYADGSVNITNATVTGLIYAHNNGTVNITGGSVQGGIWAENITVNNSSGCGAGVIQAKVDDQSIDPSGTLAVWDEVKTLFVGAPTNWKIVKSN